MTNLKRRMQHKRLQGTHLYTSVVYKIIGREKSDVLYLVYSLTKHTRNIIQI